MLSHLLKTEEAGENTILTFCQDGIFEITVIVANLFAYENSMGATTVANLSALRE